MIKGKCSCRVISFHDITAAKNAEEKIIESEQRYRSLIEQASDAICIVDASLKVIEINTSGCQYLGYSKEEFLQLTVADVFFIEDFTATPIKMDDLLSGKTIRNERKIKRKDGTTLQVELSAKLLKDGRIMIFGRDITERKQAELKLKESNERYTLLSRATNDMVWDWDLLTGHVYRNKEGWRKIFKCTDTYKENIYDWENRIHADDREKIKDIITGIQNSANDFFEVECRVMIDETNFAYIHDRGYITRNEEGKPVRMIGAAQDITERKIAELQVAKSELRFRSLVQNISDLISILDENANYLYCSPAIKEILGYEPSFMIGKSSRSFIHPDDIGMLKIYEKKIKTSGYIELPPFRYKNAQGEWRWLESKVTDMRINPEVLGYVFNSRDVTERILAEAILIKRENQFAIAAQIANLAYWEMDVVNAVYTFNDQFYTVFKTSALQMGGYTMTVERYVEVFVYPGDRTYVAMQIEKTFQSTEPLHTLKLEHRIVYGSGDIGYISVSCYIVNNEAGETIRSFGINQDITEQKIAEEKIKESELRYRSLIEQATDAICITDADMKVIDINPIGCKMMGYSKEEFMGLSVAELLVVDDLAANPLKLEELKSGNSIRNQRRFKRKDGTFIELETNVQILQDGRWMLFAHDITERKEAEEKLQLSEAILELKNKELQQKNKELEQFAYVASHDLQEPLRTTTGFVELIKKQYKGKLDKNADKYLEFISEASGRMKVLINDLLDFSRIGKNAALKKIDCNLMMQQMLADITVLVKESHATIQYSSLPVVEGYPTEIKLLFQNLVINAIKFRKKEDAPQIKITAVQTKGYWQFAISDNGIGLEPKYSERIFEIFRQLHTKKEYAGSGIGLAHCKKIVELHNGKIWVQSEPGKGSTFYFTIKIN